MRFYCACIHPAPDDAVAMAKMPEGYQLSAAELASIQYSVIGVPITYEHTGIVAAVDKVCMNHRVFDADTIRYELQQLADASHTHSILGTVTDCWMACSGSMWVTFYIKDVYDVVNWLISKGHMYGVSLTHTMSDEHTLLPLEVSLCRVPARPRCYVYRQYNDAIGANTYKRLLEQGVILDSTTMSDETPAPPPTDAAKAPTEIERVLHALSPEQRKLIEDRLIAASLNEKTAIQRMKDAQRSANVSTNALRSQIEILRGHIDPTMLENYSIATEKDIEPLYSTDAEEFRPALNRFMVAASATIMRLQAQTNNNEHTTLNHKRPRMEPTSAAAPPASAPRTDSMPRTNAQSDSTIMYTNVSTDDRSAALYAAVSDTYDML